jgi:methanogenic corrinoid protein MtbC1
VCQPALEWAEEIGADAYAENATEAVDALKGLVGAA